MIELRVSEPDPIILEAEEQDQASLAVLEAFVSGGDIPAYTGSYNVTPTQSQQTLETNGKKMVRDVKVAPIPSQYIIPEGTLEVTQNGQQSVREYENVNVNVPAPTGEKTITVTQNGTTTEDVANYATAKVVTNVPASAVDSGTKNINSNGTHNVVGYASANVNVPNTYSQSDEGKVVSNGALVSQSSATYTENGTYDTTLKNEVVVDVQSGGGITKVEGDFTIASESNYNSPTITHNLGTQKIGVLIYPTTTLVPQNMRRAFYHEFINTNALCGGQTWVLDCTQYNTKVSTPFNIAIPSDKLDVGYTMITPDNDSSDWANGNPAYCHIRSGQVALTDNTFKYNGQGYSNRFPVGTYHYIIWKLG